MTQPDTPAPRPNPWCHRVEIFQPQLHWLGTTSCCVECTSCGMQGPEISCIVLNEDGEQIGTRDAEAEALAAWNRRPEPTADAVEAVAKLRDFADKMQEASASCCIDPDAGPDAETSVSFTGEEGASLAHALHSLLARAAIASMPGAGRRDMSSAPRDGTEIVGLTQKGYVLCAWGNESIGHDCEEPGFYRRAEGDWDLFDGFALQSVDLVAWMPLPPAPAKE